MAAAEIEITGSSLIITKNGSRYEIPLVHVLDASIPDAADWEALDVKSGDWSPTFPVSGDLEWGGPYGRVLYLPDEPDWQGEGELAGRPATHARWDARHAYLGTHNRRQAIKITLTNEPNTLLFLPVRDPAGTAARIREASRTHNDATGTWDLYYWIDDDDNWDYWSQAQLTQNGSELRGTMTHKCVYLDHYDFTVREYVSGRLAGGGLELNAYNSEVLEGAGAIKWSLGGWRGTFTRRDAIQGNTWDQSGKSGTFLMTRAGRQVESPRPDGQWPGRTSHSRGGAHSWSIRLWGRD
jgi:hypothetical protein